MYPPPLPPWEGLHPLVVHFPIALLLLTPVFVLLAALLGSRGRWFGLTALLLLVIGTAGAAFAVSTGEAARDVVADGPDEMWDVMEDHEESAVEARNAFVALAVLYGVILLLPVFARKLNRIAYYFPANLLFLGLMLLAINMLSNAAHLGGRLVHQYGVRSALADGLVPAEMSYVEADSGYEDLIESDDDAMEEDAAGEEADEAASDEATADEAASDDAMPDEAAAEEPTADEALDPPADEPPQADPTEAEPAEESPAEAEPAEQSPTPESPAEETPAEAEPADEPPPTEPSPAEPMPEEPPPAESKPAPSEAPDIEGTGEASPGSEPPAADPQPSESAAGDGTAG